MKKTVRFLAFFFALTLLFSYSVVPMASVNDARFASYVNMGENVEKNGYVVPNLFRQDSVYSNVQKFPLVVQNGVEYVPLSMFILYSNVDVNYSKTGENFFLVNNNNNRYISFNVEEGIASTHDGDLLKLPVVVFNKTRYVPARTVAIVLGFTCETYDDAQKGIYAFRISDGRSKNTLSQLIQPYIQAWDESRSKDDPPTPPIQQEDPLDNVAPRRIALCYANVSYSDTSAILGVLDGYRIKASFSVTEEDILERTSLVRDIYVSGHSLLVTADVEGDTPEECAENYINGLEKANKALVKILNKKTRMCALPFDVNEETVKSAAFVQAVQKAGYVLFAPNTDTDDSAGYSGSAYNISSKIKNKISQGFDSETHATVTAYLWCSEKTQYYTADVGNYINKYRQHWFCAMNEALLHNS